MILNESLFEHTVTQYFVFLKVGGLGFLGVLKSHKSLCITSAWFLVLRNPPAEVWVLGSCPCRCEILQDSCER